MKIDEHDSSYFLFYFNAMLSAVQQFIILFKIDEL